MQNPVFVEMQCIFVLVCAESGEVHEAMVEDEEADNIMAEDSDDDPGWSPMVRVSGSRGCYPFKTGYFK